MNPTRAREEAACNSHFRVRVGGDDGRCDGLGEYGVWTAAERDEDAARQRHRTLRLCDPRIEHGELGPDQRATSAASRRRSGDASVDDEIRAAGADPEVMHGDHERPDAPRRGHPSLRVLRDRIVDDDHVGRHCGQGARPFVEEHVGTERERRLTDGGTTAHGHQRTHTERARERQAPHHVPEPATRSGRRTKHHTNLSEGRHARPR
jgi:hypothetical protein